MNKKAKAIEYFRMGYNCAQSVFLPFAGANEINTLVSAGFGGGIARMQKTCGAVTGGVMVLSLRYGSPDCPDEESKKRLYSQIRQFDDEFVKIHGTDECIKLLGVDMNSGEGKQKIKELDLHTTVCEKCILTAISLLEK
jgi:C_GCAxxG_C_C family probable redox protein